MTRKCWWNWQVVKAPRIEDLPQPVSGLVDEVRSLKQNLQAQPLRPRSVRSMTCLITRSMSAG